MCGIVGVFAIGKMANIKEEEKRTEVAITLSNSLMKLTQERGKDATGVALQLNNGDFFGLKMGIPAVELLSRFGQDETHYNQFIKLWRHHATDWCSHLGHCRKTSVGAVYDNCNNHPIVVDNIIGVHNGTLSNHDEIFKQLNCKRDGTVDSEAIFRLINKLSSEGTEPFTTEMLVEVTSRLVGSFAVMAINANNPYQVAMFRDQRPIVLALIKPLQLLIAVSEQVFLDKALYDYNQLVFLHKMGIPMPPIFSEMVDIYTMPDETIALADLTHEVTSDSKVVDLILTEKVPRKRMWAPLTKTYYSGTYRGGALWDGYADDDLATNIKKTGTLPVIKTTIEEVKIKAAEVSATSVSSTSSSKKDIPKGFVWNDRMDKFVQTTAGMEEAQKIDTTELKTVLIEVNKDKNNVTLTEGNPNIEINTVSDPAEVEELHMNKVITKDEKGPEINTIEDIDVISVNVDVNTEAMVLANNAVSKIDKFETNTEVVVEMNFSDEDSFKALPLFSLANRLKKRFFKDGFYAGFIEGTKDTTKTDIAKVTYEERLSKSEKHIRNLKTFIKMLIMCLSKKEDLGTLVEASVIEILNKKEELEPTTLDSIFSIGDTRDNNALRVILQIITDKARRHAG